MSPPFRSGLASGSTEQTGGMGLTQGDSGADEPCIMSQLMMRTGANLIPQTMIWRNLNTEPAGRAPGTLPLLHPENEAGLQHRPTRMRRSISTSIRPYHWGAARERKAQISGTLLSQDRHVSRSSATPPTSWRDYLHRKLGLACSPSTSAREININSWRGHQLLCATGETFKLEEQSRTRQSMPVIAACSCQRHGADNASPPFWAISPKYPHRRLKTWLAERM